MDKNIVDKIQIIKLTNCNNKFFNTISNWMYEWWGPTEGWNIEKVKEYMKNSLCIDRVPQTFIATIDDEVVGMYQLSMNDLDVRPDIYPWIINVYVDEKYRGLGISRILVENSFIQAKKLNLDKLYLYTKHIGLYEKYGFRFINEIKTCKKDSPIERLYVFDLQN